MHRNLLQRVGLLLIFITAVTGTAWCQGSSAERLSDEIFTIGTVNSFLVDVNGELILEEYRGNMNAGRATNIKSASKSVLSLLIGIAIQEGFIESTNETIGQYFPEYFEANPDSVKESITIKDLLTMRSGLETTSFHNYGRWVISSNWVRFILDQPMEETPGGRMIYSTGTSHLLSVILSKAAGMSTREFAIEYLFSPMDIQAGGWDRDPQGYYMGGNNMALSPMALLKIGRMVMNLGQYQGSRIVPAEWILDSMKVYTRSNFNPYNYGYMWWRRDVGEYEVVFAWGNSGQYIMMLPELDAVIAITSNVESNNGSRRYQRRMFTFLENRLIPYLKAQI